MHDEITVLKEASCPSLSAQSTLTYEIGTDQSGIHFRIVKNPGNGIFSSEWVPLHVILALLQEQEGPFIWSVLCSLFEGRSVNTACFLMAALKNEGLVQQSTEQPRRYELADVESRMKALMPKSKKGGKTPLAVIDPPGPLPTAPRLPP